MDLWTELLILCELLIHVLGDQLRNPPVFIQNPVLSTEAPMYTAMVQDDRMSFGCSIEEGFDYLGYDLGYVLVDNLEDCCLACDRVPNCVGWFHYHPSLGLKHCWLKGKMRNRVPEPKGFAGTKALANRPPTTTGTGCVDEEFPCAYAGFGACKTWNAYFGTQSTTRNGNRCEYWSIRRYYTWKENGFGFEEDHNYCRNPDGRMEGPWCFTGENEYDWEYCYEPCTLPNILSSANKQ